MGLERKLSAYIVLLTFVSLSYCLYISISDRFVTPQLLRVLYEFGAGV